MAHPTAHSDQTAIDTANASFWDELCGSSAARAWGITDATMESLRRYDENFLRYYPYLDRHIPWADLRGKRVLEIGLGYGTVSQKLAESGAIFIGLDIAANAAAMVNHRLRQSGLPGEAIQGNILTPPLADGTFDAIVAIGCLHHTGDMRAAIASCRRLLAPGGLFIGMVYYVFLIASSGRSPREPFSTSCRSCVAIRAPSTMGRPLPTITRKTGLLLRVPNSCPSDRCALFAASLPNSARELKTQTRSFRSCCGDAINSYRRRYHGFAVLICTGAVSGKTDQLIIGQAPE